MDYLFLMSPPEGQDGGGFSSIIFLVLIIGVFYFFMIRPQMKKQKELRNFRNKIEKGDKVITSGGIYGRIIEVQDTFVFLEIDTNVKIKVDKAALISSPQDLETKK